MGGARRLAHQPEFLSGRSVSGPRGYLSARRGCGYLLRHLYKRPQGGQHHQPLPSLGVGCEALSGSWGECDRGLLPQCLERVREGRGRLWLSYAHLRGGAGAGHQHHPQARLPRRLGLGTVPDGDGFCRADGTHSRGCGARRLCLLRPGFLAQGPCRCQGQCRTDFARGWQHQRERFFRRSEKEPPGEPCARQKHRFAGLHHQESAPLVAQRDGGAVSLSSGGHCRRSAKR